jgi:hypothetical protein
MINEESHRAYAIRVLEGIGPFLSKRRGDLSMPERTALTFWMSTLIETLRGLPTEYRARSGSDVIKDRVEMAKNLLIGTPST